MHFKTWARYILAWSCFSLTGSPGCSSLPADVGPALEVWVGNEYSAAEVTIEAFPLDPHSGEPDYTVLLGSGITDMNGLAIVEIAEYHPLILLVARGGYTSVYWSSEVIQLDIRGHSAAAVPYFRVTENTHNRALPISLTPITGIVYAHAQARLRRGNEETMVRALSTSNGLLQNHLLGSASQG